MNAESETKQHITQQLRKMMIPKLICDGCWLDGLWNFGFASTFFGLRLKPWFGKNRFSNAKKKSNHCPQPNELFNELFPCSHQVRVNTERKNMCFHYYACECRPVTWIPTEGNSVRFHFLGGFYFTWWKRVLWVDLHKFACQNWYGSWSFINKSFSYSSLAFS